jgi:hypothetical protein
LTLVLSARGLAKISTRVPEGSVGRCRMYQ